MDLVKIRILNFKSIKEVTLDVQQIDDSATTIFVGRNETGKSNLLQAIGFLSEPKGEYNYDAMKNAQNDSLEPINFYYTYHFSTQEEWRNIFEAKILAPKEFLERLNIKGVEKNVYLAYNSKNLETKNRFLVADPENAIAKYSYREINHDGLQYEIVYEKEVERMDRSHEFKKLTAKDFAQILNSMFSNLLIENKQNVSRWHYSKENLITETIDLNEFKDNLELSIPLKNIFNLAGFNSQEDIKNKIESLLNGPKNINKLEKILENTATDHIRTIWPESGVVFKIKIQDDLKLDIYIVDEADDENSFYISDRSEGFKQFISLIMGISAQNSSDNLKNKVIIIDEPETHMHPSGIRYMRDELFKIGKNNYVFIATHSQYIVDAQHKERHYIVNKVENNTTVHKWMNEDSVPDDEILRQAFGLNVLSDILEQHKISKENYSAELYNKALRILYPSAIANLKEEILKDSEERAQKEQEEENSNITNVYRKISETAKKVTQFFDSEKTLPTFAQKH